jgi:glycerol dehydrogenase
MIKQFIAPRRYIQGVGILAEIGKYVGPLGKRVMMVWGPNASAIFGEAVEASCAEYELELISFKFSGECSKTQVALGMEMATAKAPDVVVGLGGGKAIDLSKAIAMEAGTKLVSVPTIASNDAPTSSATVYYSDEGDFEGWAVWPANPDLVLVDTKVVVEAPVRWFVSGMGDALCTWYEAEAAFKKRAVAIAGGGTTMAAMALAKLCGDIILEYGVDARRDCENHVVTPAVEKVTEANTLLSGLGFESGGVAAAHAVGNGLSDMCKEMSHGEKVAFGLVTQLCLDEDMDPDERLEVVDFCIDVGLPVTFEALGIGDISAEELMSFAEILCGPGQITHNHPFPVTPFDMYSALVAADALGKERLALDDKE